MEIRAASRRVPERWALLIIDMLNDFAAEGDYAYKRRFWQVAGNIKQLATYCRQLSVPVIYVCDRHKRQDYGESLKSTKTPPHAVEGTTGAAVVVCLEPGAQDLVVPKTMYSGFFRTELEQLLTDLDIDTVIVTGVHTHVCVLATAMDAFSRELLVFVPHDCTTTIRDEAYRFALDFVERHVGTVLDSQSIQERVAHRVI